MEPPLLLLLGHQLDGDAMPRVVGEPAQIPHGRRALRLRIMCRIHRLTHELGGASRAGGGWQRYLKREVIRGRQRSSVGIRVQ